LVLVLDVPEAPATTDLAVVGADAQPGPLGVSVRTGGQCPDGAIANHPPDASCDPYLANFVALGLLRAATATGEVRYSSAA